MLSAVAAGLGANAKVAVGPEVGLSLSNLKIEYPNTAFRNRMSTGLRAGFAASIEAGRSFSVHTGLYYQNKGSNIVLGVANSYFASHFVVHALQVPVYLTLQSKPGPFGRLFAGVGPFVDCHLSGKEYIGINSTESKIGSNRKDDIKRFDAGIGLQVGYRVNNGMLLRLQYQHGLPNISPILNQDIRSRGFSVTVGYLGL